MRFALTLLCALFFLHRLHALRTDQAFWAELARHEMEEALRVKWNLNPAKNVIYFVGDGMGPNTITATRIYKGGETHKLAFEEFPHVGLLKTYAADQMVPDSACTATALFCGLKTNRDVVAVDATVQRRDCARSLVPEARLDSLADAALAAGKSAGFITTMRVTHATPSPLYAHSADRSWECEAMMPPEAAQCKDIARQLIEDEPGRNFNVILGGGRITLVSSDEIPTNPWNCQRHDGRNLIETYIEDKERRGFTHAVVSNNVELQSVNYDETDYLLGIFADSHLPYEYERDSGPQGTPSLAELVEAAIKVLRKNDNGYFLMVEGGNIDMAHHRGRAKVAIDETAALDDAIRVAMEMTDEEDTLLIVTSDHTHTLSINGYPERGSDILGTAGVFNGANYTTLSYATGGPESIHFFVRNDTDPPTVARRDAGLEDTASWDYHQVSGIELVEGSHGGGEVTVYARGPFSHLFHSVHEQHFVYHVVQHAFNAPPLPSRTAPAASLSALAILLVLAVPLFTLGQRD